MTGKKIQCTCGFCSTGCNLTASVEEDGGLKVLPSAHYPVNRGSACPKGFLFLEPLKAPDRATTPYLRNERGDLEPVDWDQALQAFVGNFKAIQRRHGKESVAFLGTGQLPTEEIAFLGALAKFGMGLLHGDGNTRQCMATAAAAHKRAFGFDSPPFTYRDFEESDVLVFIGANPAVAHPIMWNRVKRNSNRPALVLIDPRKTETAQRATQHCAIRPDSLLAFLYGVAHILIRENWLLGDYIEKHTLGFEEFKKQVLTFEPAAVARQCGVKERGSLFGGPWASTRIIRPCLALTRSSIWR
jgi:assimilatory nitrate reductase catalytic subunit